MFHKNLYVGESVCNVKRVKWKIRHRAGQIRVFIIALAGGTDQLEIYHCAFLQQRYYKKNPPCIVGIAGSYKEAVELVQKMAADVYEKTGGYQIKEYFLSAQACKN